MSEVTPRDREEKLLAAIAGGTTEELPTPRNRKEKLLKEIYDNGGGGGGGGESAIAWRPTVDADGNISWERTVSTVKPATQNIKGPQGEVPIDDETISETSVWSSQKIAPYIGIHATDITELIEAGGHIKLAEGEYIITRPIAIPSETIIEGCGYKTIIRPQISGNVYNLLTLLHNTTIRNCRFTGNGNTFIGEVPTDDNCIYIAGILNRLENIIIENFGGRAIWLYNDDSGTQRIFSAIITNCYIVSCGFGILLEAEYNTVSNCVIRGCCYGCMITYGNNLITGCHLNKNLVCLRVNAISTTTNQKYANNGHSSIIGCTFNHAGRLNTENAGWAFYIDHMDVGVIISGCQWFYGLGEVIDSKGVLIESCEFGSGTFKSHDNVGLVMLRNNMIQNAVTIEESDTNTQYSSNYYFDGTEWKA